MARTKQLDGKLTNFNTKVTADHKLTMDAIVKLNYGSVREMLEDWTQKFLADNPEAAKKVESYLQLTQGG
ncbi:hypothetical protein [Lysinibacillus sp. 54212]|uniref:hypothetical protein n=1 Tax=Lysinibacillus sp. 54212 TaxID=3119829 RepID=UPI002FC64F6E